MVIKCDGILIKVFYWGFKKVVEGVLIFDCKTVLWGLVRGSEVLGLLGSRGTF